MECISIKIFNKENNLPQFLNKTEIRIDENINHVLINNNGIVISDDNGKVIQFPKENLLQILK